MNSSVALSCREPNAAIRRAISGLCGTPLGEWRPLEGGRSNQVWRCDEVVVKLYRPDAATPLFGNDPALEAAALCALAPLGLAPNLLAKGADWIAWRHVPGQTWQGEAGIAALFRRLSMAPAFAGLPQHPMGAKAIAAQALAFAPPGLPPIPDPVDVVLPKPSLLHGDLVPGNIICGATDLCLIDWQCPALGDPVDDLALFLSPAMQWLYRGQPLEREACQSLLLQLPETLRYRYAQLASLLHWRIAAHCAFRTLRGDADYDTALRLELTALQSS